MTNLPRITISTPPDIESAIRNLRSDPKYRDMPLSKIVCELIRRGMERGPEENPEMTEEGTE